MKRSNGQLPAPAPVVSLHRDGDRFRHEERIALELTIGWERRVDGCVREWRDLRINQISNELFVGDVAFSCSAGNKLAGATGLQTAHASRECNFLFGHAG